MVSRAFDNCGRWEHLLSPFRRSEAEILEIGSSAGASALSFLTLLPGARITCVDPWPWDGAEAKFDATTRSVRDRITKMKERSISALDKLIQRQRIFDVIYVDGSHTRADCLIDSVLGWQLLDANGLMIWDDYVWEANHLAPADRPQDAIDAFLSLYGAELTIFEKGYQVIAQKRKPSEITEIPSEDFIYPRTIGNVVRFITRRPMARPRHGR